MNEIFMAYQGEMALKGLNRRSFESMLEKNLRRRLKSLGSFDVRTSQSTIYITPKGEVDGDAAFERIRTTFGLAAVTRAVGCEKTLESICETAEAVLGEQLAGAKTFKVMSKRADKSFPMTSMELSAQVGGYLLQRHHHLKVDVKDPEVTVFCEVRDGSAFVHGAKQPAVGGLPVSTSGKAALLLSGGIDSPVAGYMMAKRGLHLMGIHFASPPYTSERAKQKVITLAKLLVPYTGRMTVWVVPYTEIQEHLHENGPEVLFTVLMRRSMMRIANILCGKYGCDGIVTGESLAQVASQTLAALQCTDAAQLLPVLRPLIGMDKVEITAIAREIGTYETSILPYEDCCTVFTPPHPKTRPTLQEIEAAEAELDLAAMEAAAAEAAEKVFVDFE